MVKLDVKYWKIVSMILSGTMISQIIGFISLPIILSIYSASDFGIYTQTLAVSGLFSVVSFIGLEKAIPIIKGCEVKSYFIKIINVFIIVSTIALCFFCFFIVDILPKGVNAFIVIVYGFSITFYALLLNLYIREGEHKLSTITKIGHAILIPFLQYVFFYIKLDYYGLIVGDIFAKLLISLCCFLYFFIKNNTLFKCESNSFSILKYKEFTTYGVISSFLVAITLNAPVIIIGKLYGNLESAQYSIVLKYCMVPIGMIGSSIGQLYYSELSGRVRDGKILIKYFYKTFKRLLFISPVVVIPYIIILSYTFEFLVSKEYGDISMMPFLFLPLLCAQMIASPLSMTATCLSLQKVDMYFMLFRVTLILMSFYISFYVYKLDYTVSVLLFSTVSAVTYIVLVFINKSLVLNYDKRKNY